MIYFIQDKAGKGPIKIGITEANIKTRLLAIQVGNPAPLVVLKTIKGDYALEKSIHYTFRDLHVFGEWFNPEVALLAFIDNPTLDTLESPQVNFDLLPQREKKQCEGFANTGKRCNKLLVADQGDFCVFHDPDKEDLDNRVSLNIKVKRGALLVAAQTAYSRDIPFPVEVEAMLWRYANSHASSRMQTNGHEGE